jgi:mersacidin/lichenicidin family type 2 lantibiotic
MIFDTVRAWKDETYRLSLSQEQLDSLPAHPAGELAETDLALVSGGSEGTGATGASSSTFHAVEVRHHSFSGLICDINIFSNNIEVLSHLLINVGNVQHQVCINND